MKTATKRLIKLAKIYSVKYASVDAETMKSSIQKGIWTAVANASHGKLGIMPFLKMLQEDDAALNINVTRNDKNIVVSPPSLDKVELTEKYAPLSDQIKNYLTKYIELYPGMVNGQPIDYNNLTITLEYPEPTEALPIAHH